MRPLKTREQARILQSIPDGIVIIGDLRFLAILTLILILVPAMGWGDNCISCHTNASQLKGLVSPPPPSTEDEGEG